jgi:hypothetical protein
MPTAAPRVPVSRLGQVQRGRQKISRRIVIHGEGGLGKTTLAAGAPRPIFIDLNQGSAGFDVARYPFDGGRTRPETFAELLAAVRDVATNGAGEFGTLVIDALSDVEPLVWAEVVRRDGKAKNIVDGNLSFNKGYEAAVDEWRRLVEALEGVWRAGLHIVLLDHSDVKKDKNASGADYGRFAPKIHLLASRFLHTWSDFTFFLQVETVLVPDNVDDRKAKKLFAESNGKRLIHARPAAEWIAKSRPELPDPIELPVSGGWQMLDALILTARIEEYSRTLPEARADKLRAALVAAAGSCEKLQELDDRCVADAAKKGA